MAQRCLPAKPTSWLEAPPCHLLPARRQHQSLLSYSAPAAGGGHQAAEAAAPWRAGDLHMPLQLRPPTSEAWEPGGGDRQLLEVWVNNAKGLPKPQGTHTHC